MITSLKGSVIARREKSLVLEVGGVGYEVFVPTQEMLTTKIGDERFFWTFQHVREDVLALYGFRTEEELEFFHALIAISDVGPRSALSLLSVAPLEKIRAAIAAGDLGILPHVPGIGRKTADRIVVELKDKVGAAARAKVKPELKEVVDALTSLGYSRQEAEEAARTIPEDSGSTEEKVRQALKSFDRRHKAR